MSCYPVTAVGFLSSQEPRPGRRRLLLNGLGSCCGGTLCLSASPWRNISYSILLNREVPKVTAVGFLSS